MCLIVCVVAVALLFGPGLLIIAAITESQLVRYMGPESTYIQGFTIATLVCSCISVFLMPTAAGGKYVAGICGIVLFVTTLGVAIYGSVQISHFYDQVGDRMTFLIKQTGVPGSNNAPTMGVVQQGFQCCGNTSSAIYGDDIPKTCYSPDNVLYKQGCTEPVYYYFKKLLLTMDILLYFLTIPGIIALCVLVCMAGR